MRVRWWVVVDLVLWVALTAYIFWGITAVPFHEDESIYISASENFHAVFIERDLRILTIIYKEDGETFVRDTSWAHIVNPPLAQYLIGMTLAAAGYGIDDLPEMYDFAQPLAANLELGRLPTEDMLYTARIPAAALLSLTVVVLYLIGRTLDGRRLGYLAAGLFALHPRVLLHGRRAMHEAPVMLFGMVVVGCAMLILVRRTQGRPIPVGLWLAFAVSCGLAFASKFTGAAYIVGACLALVLADVLMRDWGRIPRTVGWLAGCGVLAVGLWLAMSPQLWGNTLWRIQESYTLRADVAEGHIQNNGDDGNLTERTVRAVTWSYMNEPSWRDSLRTGVRFGTVGGAALLVLTGFGVVVASWRVWRDRGETGILYLVLLLPLLMWFVVLMATPLGWARYYVPPIPLVVLITGVGVFWIVDRFLSSYGLPASGGTTSR